MRRDQRPQLRLGPVLRRAFKAPTALYERNLGWVLGRRFLCLTHIGRKSGRQYRTVLEVIGEKPADGEVLAIAGLGPSSDWYRNILVNPPLEVTVGRQRFTPGFRTLDRAEALAVMADYERHHRLFMPILRPGLSRLLGWSYDSSDAARERLVEELPIVAFSPR